MSDRNNRDYEIGKGRPPKHAQYRPGQSGNPKGRPKGVRNLATDLAEELSERVQVREGGRQRSLSKQRALLKALFAKALQGDSRSASLLIALMGKLIQDDPVTAAERPLSVEDEALLDAFVRRRTPVPAPTETAAPAAPETSHDHD